MHKRRLRHIFAVIVCLIVAAPIWFFLIPGSPLSEPPVVRWGVTFNPRHAEYFGLPWKETYRGILDDLQVRSLRLSSPWDTVEPVRGQYDFSEIDWMLKEAQSREVKVLLAIGQKVPRWPECHIPQWAQRLSQDERQRALLAMVEATVRHLRASPSIEEWQVENEPLFSFGQCPPPNKELLQKEIAVVRGLDQRAVVITDSGELSTWWKASALGDILGVTVYRRTWNRLTGYVTYPLAPAYYVRKAKIIQSRVGRIIDTELQMEPWAAASILDMSVDDQLNAFSLNDFRENIQFVQKIGFDQHYLWGVEWWVWMKNTKQHPEFYNEAKALFTSH